MRYAYLLFALFLLNNAIFAQFQPIALPFEAERFSAFDENRIFAIVRSGGTYTLQKTTNGGTSWSPVSLPSTLSGGTLGISLQVIDSDNLLLYFQLHPSYDEFLYKSTNGGQTWTNLSSNLPQTQSMLFLRFFDAQNGLMLTRDFNNHVFVRRTTNGGNSWSTQTLTVQGSPLGVATHGNQNIWFFTSSGKLWRSNNGGIDWQTFDTGFDADNYGLAMSFKDSLYGIAAVDLYAHQLQVTQDGGATWTPLPSNPLPLQPGQAFIYSLINLKSSPNGWLIATSKGTAYTIDEGQNWVQETNYPDFLLSAGLSKMGDMLFASSYDSPDLLIWKGPFDGQNHCVQLLDSLHSSMEYGICKPLMARLEVRANIEGDTSIDLRFTQKFEPNTPAKTTYNIKTGCVGCSIDFKADPGQQYIGTLTVEVPLNNIDTSYLQQLQLAPTGCPTQAAPTFKIKAGYWSNWYHPECFAIDTSNCAITLQTNVCGADTNQYDIYYQVQNGPIILGNTYSKNPSYHELVHFYILEKGQIFDWNLPNGCFERISALYTCGVSGTEMASKTDKIILFPNPASSVSTLIWPRAWGDDVKIQVFDHAGKEVRSTHANGVGTAELDGTHLPNGLYFVHISPRIQPKTIQKWVISHE